MKHLEGILWLLVLVLLCGCGGGGITSDSISRPTARPILGPSSDPAPLVRSMGGDWQFNATSTVPETPPLESAGSIFQSGTSVSGALHVDGSNCFDRMTTVRLTGSLTGGNMSVITTPVAGQVITLTGDITETAPTDGRFTGTYAINGGCANGEQGNVTGIRIPSIANIFNGTFTSSGGETFDVAGNIGQDAISSSDEATFGITGTVTFSKACFSSGTITTGRFPSGSYILGTSVALVIAQDNGTAAFLGTLNPDTSEITGNYTVSGSTCDQSGTALLVSNPWDY